MIISSFIMITINKAKEIAKYVSDFASSRFEDIDILKKSYALLMEIRSQQHK